MSDERASSGLDEKLGAALKQIRLAGPLTEQMLADKLGVDLEVLRKYEAGAHRIPASALCELARILGVPVGQLLGAVKPDKVERADLIASFANLQSEKVRRGVIDLLRTMTPANDD